MSRYDGLIIPRSYSEYINKTDAATLSQALQLSGVMDNAPTSGSNKPARSGGIFSANAVITSDNTTLTGVAISADAVVRVMFTAALTGSDDTTGLTLTYNGTAYAVKAGKDGALEALTAHLIEESYVYLQAYTTLELMFDGSQFVVMGNPVVISNADFSIMADGSITYHWKLTTRNYLPNNSSIDIDLLDNTDICMYEIRACMKNTGYQFMGFLAKTSIASSVVSSVNVGFDITYDRSTKKLNVKNISGYELDVYINIKKIY